MAVVLFAALLHAAWNALVRASARHFHDIVLLVLGIALWAGLALPFVAMPNAASWPWLVASSFIHVFYFGLVAVSYRGGDLSFAYPLMRGLAPALTALGAVLFIGESPSPGGWAGVLLICAGVLLLAGDALRAGSMRLYPTLGALGNAGVICLFTLVDGQGVRLSGNAFAYTACMFLLTASLMLLTMLVAGQGARLARRAHSGWRMALVGSACTLASYALALWAMTHASIALVAALRETSVIFATLIAALVLKEPVSALRCVSVVVVTAGAVAIKAF